MRPTVSKPQLLSMGAAPTDACAHGACALQQAKPLQLHARAPQLEKAGMWQHRHSAAINK